MGKNCKKQGSDSEHFIIRINLKMQRVLDLKFPLMLLFTMIFSQSCHGQVIRMPCDYCPDDGFCVGYCSNTLHRCFGHCANGNATDVDLCEELSMKSYFEECVCPGKKCKKCIGPKIQKFGCGQEHLSCISCTASVGQGIVSCIPNIGDPEAFVQCVLKKVSTGCRDCTCKGICKKIPSHCDACTLVNTNQI